MEYPVAAFAQVVQISETGELEYPVAPSITMDETQAAVVSQSSQPQIIVAT